MKLHVGCGTNKIPGWVNIDAVESCQPDLIHDLSKPLPYPDLSADELRAESVLEHFDKYMRYCVCSDWVRVLKVGGFIHIGVPDFKKLLFRFFKFRFDDFVDTFFGENMWESEIYIGHFGNHKWGYSQKSLTAFLGQFGIEPVEVKTIGLNIHFVGRKLKHVSTRDMDQWKIYSHNNKFGAPRHYLTFAEVKAKINEFQKDSAY
ncbi:MAG: hypothetical protein HY209_00300 [Candidatus Omnitrophica bacterium]|nr:hypothetical protein [Candidatus Omnitrophota bacterium]